MQSVKTAPHRTVPHPTVRNERTRNVLIFWDPQNIASGETDLLTKTLTRMSRSGRCQGHGVEGMNPGIVQHYDHFRIIYLGCRPIL